MTRRWKSAWAALVLAVILALSWGAFKRLGKLSETAQQSVQEGRGGATPPSHGAQDTEGTALVSGRRADTPGGEAIGGGKGEGKQGVPSEPSRSGASPQSDGSARFQVREEEASSRQPTAAPAPASAVAVEEERSDAQIARHRTGLVGDTMVDLSCLVMESRVLRVDAECMQPVPVTFTIRNTGSRPMTVSKRVFQFLSGHLAFSVVFSGTVPCPVHAFSMTTEKSGKKVTLLPGEGRDVVLDLRGVADMDWVGEYSVRFGLDEDGRSGEGKKVRWEPAELVIKVALPTDTIVGKLLEVVATDKPWRDYRRRKLLAAASSGEPALIALFEALSRRFERDITAGVEIAPQLREAVFMGAERVRVGGWIRARDMPSMKEYIRLPSMESPERRALQAIVRRLLLE